MSLGRDAAIESDALDGMLGMLGMTQCGEAEPDALPEFVVVPGAWGDRPVSEDGPSRP